MAERTLLRVAALATVRVVAGCGGERLAVDDAPDRLGPVVDEVAAALVDDAGASDVPPAAGSLAPGEDATCYYRSQAYTFPERLGVDSSLDELRVVVAAAL